MARHFLSIGDFTKEEIIYTLDLSDKVKASPGDYSTKLLNKTLVLLFEKPSTRTRLSFEAGFTRLGGHAIYFDLKTSQVTRGETLEDTIRTVSRYADAVSSRVLSHKTLETFAANASVPIINALSDVEHPCQTLADLLTIRENGKLGGRILYVGDGNNVCNSLGLACEMLGLEFVVSCPKGYEPKLGKPEIVYDPKEAASGADVIYADVWVSMGDEGRNVEDFHPYQVNCDLLAAAKDDCIVLDCLPAHRGEEITDDVIDGPNSRVFDQAENRMHTQNALLLKLLDV